MVKATKSAPQGIASLPTLMKRYYVLIVNRWLVQDVTLVLGKGVKRGKHMDDFLERISWRENENAVEIGFEFYLDLLEKRIKGQKISLVQELRRFFDEELGIKLRETQARGLMHKSSSVFIEYAKGITGHDFNPTSEYWRRQGIEKFAEWRKGGC